MYRKIIRSVACLSFVLLSACAAPRAPVSDVEVTRSVVPTGESGFARLLNRTRAARGLSPMTPNAALTRAALGHAADMDRRGFFAHRSPSGTMPQHRIRRTGYRACATGEALAFNQPNPATAFEDWMNSRGHRVILMGRYTHYGFASDGPYWVFVAARPC